METAVFGGGCFWCTEAIFLELTGVQTVFPGYAGGTTKHPSYDEVASGQTGHAEVIKIDYDPSRISFRDLLTVFFASHDPTSRNRQGNDVGTQYRSVIFYTTPEQAVIAKQFVAELSASFADKPIVTEIVPLDVFWPAEDYHERYYANHVDEPYCQLVINPKLEHLREQFKALIKKQHA